MRIWLVLLLLLPVGSAATFTEDFESYSIIGSDPDLKPDTDWYNYKEPDDNGNLTADPPVPEGAQAFRWSHGETEDVSVKSGTFKLEVPIQLTETTFTLAARPLSEDGEGSMQFVALESSAPVRKIVEYYVFCINTTFTDGCELRVRFETVDTTGQVLIPASENLTEFKIRTIFDWLNQEFCLEVNGVDDGCFQMLALPQDIGRLRFGQYRGDVPWRQTFDNWTIVGGENATGVVEGDIADGLKNFASAVRFTSAGSLFFFGFVWFLILSAAVIIPCVVIGKSTALVPGVAFYEMLLVLWLVFMEWWPDWIGITAIITGAAVIAFALRRFTLGIRDASTQAAMVVGSLGYFIIASTFLGFSGYAAETVQIPTGPPTQDTVNTTESPDQSFTGAVAECVVTGGVFTFGLKGDCSQKTVSKTWSQITDIFGWIRTALNFLFQLLTFSLPIPVIFNVMIVGPPAVGLAVAAFQIIKG